MPTLATYFIENHKIEVVKSLFGKERVLLNGLIVSENFSGSKVEHHFLVGENRFLITRRENSEAQKMNTFKVLRNGSPIALVNRKQHNSYQMLLMVIAVGLGCGFIIGVLVYNIF